MLSRYLKMRRGSRPETRKAPGSSLPSVDERLRLGIDCLKVEPAPPGGVGQIMAAFPFSESSQAVKRQHRPKNSRPLTLAPVPVILTVGLAAGYACWNRNPNVDIAPPAFLTINGYNNFVFASEEIRNPELLDKAIRKSPVDPREVPLFLQENVPLAPGSDARYRRVIVNRLAFLKQNALALQNMRSGLILPFRVPRQESNHYNQELVGSVFQFSELLKIDSDVKAEQGDWAGSMLAAMDLLRLGNQHATGSRLVQQDSILRSTKLGYDLAERAMPHLSAGQLSVDARGLQQSEDARNPFSDSVQEEAVTLLADLKKNFGRPDWRHIVDRDYSELNHQETSSQGPLLLGGGPGFEIGNEARQVGQVSLFTSKRAFAEDYLDYAQALLTRVQQPYAPTRVLPQTENPLGQILAQRVSSAEVDYLSRGPLQNSLLITAMALRAYWLQHGRYPAKLEELMPRYLNHLPEDPFYSGHPLRYVRAQSTCWIYSIGPDHGHWSLNLQWGITYGYPAMFQGTAGGEMTPVVLGIPQKNAVTGGPQSTPALQGNKGIHESVPAPGDAVGVRAGRAASQPAPQQAQHKEAASQ